MAKLRVLKELPVYIEEDHHEVLPHIYKNIGAKYLPLEKNTLVHFDSHPDMLIPKDLTPEDAYDKLVLFEKISIENWILPGCFVGVFSTIVWVCPPWSDQISPGEFSFLIGRNKKTNGLSVTCLESYYVSEGLFTTKENLDNTRSIKLIVHKLEENPGHKGEQADLMQRVAEQVAEVNHFILDIDLDFYSTLNPFVTLYKEAKLYEKLKDLYSFQPIPNNLEIDEKIKLAVGVGEKRKEFLEKLGDIFTFLQREESLLMYEGVGEEYVPLVSSIVDSVRKHYPRSEVDWCLVHDAGCTFDDTELPHHVSTSHEIRSMLALTEQFLDSLGKQPTIITVSRSSADDYCPPHQVEEIQSGLVSLLQLKYSGIKLYHGYL